MNDLARTMSLSASGLKAQAARIKHVSENISNVDTPGYRRKTVAFTLEETGTETRAVRTGPVRLSQADRERIHDPSHPLADASGTYEGSNVDLMIEIADARQAQRSYEANLKAFDQARQMMAGLLDLIKR
ncbi:flagellar basal body rod protein FlgC [Roseicyclus sp. F158]|uniref:Flagellar basal body rod protein FlgC n=1 Tax=Tropicimonas omnivorans TaxID=3075590 RepID=A0ABU3DDC1_9RHOB|nr:flagellar basal body rod protein FlgC [Roseicyclus sp. F158]MDT0681692.1 flagellar basal body rod protein FlgC [Roseicyclus sp. F158]